MYLKTLQRILVVACAVLATALSAQSTSPVIFTYENHPVSLDEFEYQYLKNKKIGEQKITAADIDEYLDLYVKFKLKYQDAKDAGMDTLRDYIMELAGYRNQLARNYLYDKEVTEELITEAYERLKTEVRAAHILITIDPDASPKDTLEAYNKIKAAYDKIQAGEASFDQMARQISDDPGSKDNGGDLGYFTALQLVYPFENEAYRTEKGAVSKIFRTQFGYHIVKVLDKRPNRGDIKVKHIQLRVGHTAAATNDAVEKNINEIYNKIISGESTFEKMAHSYSEDYNSKYQGGEMDYINVTQFVGDPQRQYWVDQAFEIPKDSGISKPFRTSMGWHILMRVKVRPIGSFEQLKNSLKNQVRNDQRSQKSVDALVVKVKAENNFTEFASSWNALLSSLDSNYSKGTFKKSQLPKFAKPGKPSAPVRGNVFIEPNVNQTPLLDLQLFRIASENHSINEFADYMEKNSKPVYGDMSQALRHQYNSWVNDLCVAFQDKHLEEKSVEFRNIYQEYAEGILMFYRKKEMVWDKANSDSAGLANFFAQHRDEYRWGDRFHCEVYFCNSEAMMKKVAKQLKKKMPADSIKKFHNAVTPLSLDYKIGKYEISDNYLFADKKLLTDLFADPKNRKKKKIIAMGNYGDDWVVVKVIEFLPGSNKELNETRGPVTAKYEEYLEDIWTKSLQAKYKVTVNQEVLSGLKKKLVNSQ